MLWGTSKNQMLGPFLGSRPRLSNQPQMKRCSGDVQCACPGLVLANLRAPQNKGQEQSAPFAYFNTILRYLCISWHAHQRFLCLVIGQSLRIHSAVVRVMVVADVVVVVVKMMPPLGAHGCF